MIRRMQATFGRLENETLQLAPGLNILTAPNESGKSTWCAFLRAMLYGIDTSQREKNGIKPDKIRFAPWSGARMEGSMDLVVDGEEITIRRGSKSAAAPLRDFEAVYTGTQEPVPWLTAADAGERLTGVSAGVFERSAFVRQLGLGVESSPELERRITAMVSTGEEGQSYTQADATLRAWQRRVRHNQHGRIPALEAEAAAVAASLAELREAARGQGSLEERAELLRSQRDDCRRKVEESRSAERAGALERLGACRVEREQLRGQEAAAQEAALQARRALESSVFAGFEPAAAQAAAEKDAALFRAAHDRAAQKSSPAAHWAALGLCAALLVGAWWLWYLLIPAAAALSVFGWRLFVAGRAKKDAAKAAADCEEILSKYKIGDIEELTALQKDYGRLCERRQRAEDTWLAASRALSAFEAGQQKLEAEVLEGLDFSGGDSAAAAASRALQAAENEYRSLREDCALAQGRLEALGDPLVLETQQQALKEELQRLHARHEALELSARTLSAANAELQTRFSPGLARRTAELMTRLTGEGLAELTLSRTLDAMLRREEDTLPHEAAFLSRGALDQLYLAMRLALCELVLPAERACPVILDDALMSFDDERLAKALLLLAEQQRQVLLFTCQGREREIFAALPPCEGVPPAVT